MPLRPLFLPLAVVLVSATLALAEAPPRGGSPASAAPAPATAGGAVLRLEDLNLALCDQEWGQAQPWMAVSGKPLVVAGSKAEHGVGMHARAELAVDLKGAARRFTARLGVDDAAGAKASVVFRVVVDGRAVFDSGIMKPGMPAKALDLDLVGARRMHLLVDDAGDGNDSDHADWLDAVITCEPGRERPAAVASSVLRIRQWVDVELSGVIVLPAGRVAPAGGLKVWLNIQDKDKQGLGWPVFLVPPGGSSVAWAHRLSRREDLPKKFHVQYSMVPDVHAAFVENGWWSRRRTVSRADDADLVDATSGKAGGLRLDLLAGYTLTGTVALPAGRVAPAGGRRVWIELQNGKREWIKGTTVDIAAGCSAATWTRVYPFDAPAMEKVYLRYGIQDDDCVKWAWWTATGMTEDWHAAGPVGTAPRRVDGLALQVLPVRYADSKAPKNAVMLDSLNMGLVTTGWGKVRARRSVQDLPLSIGGERYRRGIGMHANGEFTVDLKGVATRFRARLGVDDEVKTGGSVVFRVYVDGEQALETPVLRGGQKARAVDLDLAGARTLRIVADGTADGISSDHADVADAFLELAAGATERPTMHDPDARPEARAVWLEDLDTATMRQGSSQPSPGRNLDLGPLSVAGTKYRHGVATHAAGSWIIDLGGGGERFKALVGVDDSAKGKGSVAFRVLGDDAVLWESPVLRGGDKAVPLDVDVRGVRYLTLVAGDGGDNNWWDHADWLDARIVMRPGAAHPSTARTDELRAGFWRAEFFTNTALAGRPALVRGAGPGQLALDFGWSGPDPGMPADNFSARFTRTLAVPADGVYVFRLNMDDGARLWVDNVLVHDDWVPQAASWKSLPLFLKKGKHGLRLEYFEAGGNARCELAIERWAPARAASLPVAGAVRLPDGMTAPAGGLPVSVFVVDEGAKQEYLAPVTVPAGRADAAFEVLVPKGKGPQRLLVRCRVADPRLLPEAWYGRAGGVWRQAEAVPVAVGPGGTRGLVVPLLRGVSVAGRLVLPAGLVAPPAGALVSLRSYHFTGEYSTATTVRFPAGAAAAPFSLIVPVTPDGMKHHLCYKAELPGVYPQVPWDVNNFTPMMTVVTVKTAAVTNAVVRLFAQREISGTISLPAGATAPANGFRLWVKALYREHAQYQADEVTIPEGRSSAPYRLTIPVFSAEQARQTVRYVQWSGGYKRAAYRGRDGRMVPFGTFPLDLWVDVSRGDVRGLDLQLVPDASVLSYDDEERRARAKAKQIVERVTKPHWTEFEKAIALYDWFADNVVYYSDKAAVERRFPVMEAVWTLHAPLWYGVTVCGGYTSSYSHLARLARVESRGTGNNAHAWNIVKVDGGWYHSDSTSQRNYRLFLLSGPQMRTAGNLYAQGARPVCPDPFIFNAARHYPHLKELRAATYRRLLGNVSLPPGHVAPKGGLWVSVLGQWRWIPEGTSATSWFYRANLAQHPTGKIAVECTENSGRYLPRCWWSAAGTVSDPARATMVPLAGDDVVGLDIVLQASGATVTGRLELPAGMTAPDGGIAARIVATDAKGNQLARGDVKIPEDTRGVDFTLSLPAGTKAARVRYETEAAGWAGRGYLGAAGTLPDFQDARDLALPGRAALTLLPGRRISGTFTLPPGDAPRAKEFWVGVALVVGDDHRQAVWTRFPAGTRSVPWSMYVATTGRIAAMGFKLRSEMAADRYAVLWWTPEGGHQDHTKAGLVHLAAPPATLDFTLQVGRPVSGTIRLPAGRVAPAGGLPVTVGWYERRGTWSARWWWITPVIPGGASSVDYHLLLPWPGPNASSYRFYVTPKVPGWKPEIFWTPAGSVADLAKAVELPIDRKEYPGIDFTLLPE